MSRQASRTWVAVLAGIVVIGGIWWVAKGPGGGKSQADQTVPVVAATVRQGGFVVYRSQPGTVTPSNSVLVRSQVDGVLKRVDFTGGQLVKQGDLLAEVDPRPLQAQAQQAGGDLARSQAQLANAQEVLKHYNALLAQDSISRQRVADQEALVRQYQAEVKAGQGRADTAQLQLSSGRITSPIAGMVSLRRVDPGNLVGPGDARGIAVVTQSQPSKVVFSVPVNVVPRVLERMHAGTCIPVQAVGDGPDDILATGHLLAANNQVDPATGTVKFEAEFANADNSLLPNQFVTAKLPVQVLAQAVLVPSAAIQQGAQGPFVYVVKDDKTAAVVPVKVGASDATTTVVTSGVTPGAHVVVEGADRLRSGTAVNATMAPEPPAAAVDSAACRDGNAGATPQAPNARP
ncbi:efflux RND transporter periplasmic adaptor subunit [Luteibacter pinisoli]|uniref:Efflux RND transporter periplasmic adaptor subunit n=1 Tax=Luteibacter pinisoli TaxID=2589080 RepID=A0A4Y5Z4R5_9GAMM|nr:efflux RND transporter periplasmic adaptor subunit [Luteibacter pinisoli]QDE39413.1 efflux RND transporter periplasmic adaptor subunit [Luteibacter pinisoli]